MERKFALNKLLTSLFLVFLSLNFAAQNRLLSLQSADEEFDKKNYWGALEIYGKLHEKNKTDAKVLYRMGECYLNLKNYPLALSFLENAGNLDPKVDKDLNFNLGRTYHHLAQLDEAIMYFKKFKEAYGKEKHPYYQIDSRIKQCKYAKELMANPVDVKIKNLGTGINSRFDDYAPSISADGTFMVFTSRRSTLAKGDVDYKGDFKYFEDVYFSILNEDGTWETSETLSETINTDGHDAVLSLTPNGKGIFLYKNNESSAGDIFYSERKGDFEWSEPYKLDKPINTPFFESSVSVTQDGNTMYFISERSKGFGHGDIYVSRKISSDKWGKPKNLGDRINTKGDEKFVFVHPKGNVLFFASDGHKTMGSYDIFRCVREGDKWGKPVNLGYPINTVNEESTFSMTKDNKKLLISAEYEGGVGERDIYEVDLSEFDILEELQLAAESLNGSSITTVSGRVLFKGRQTANVIISVVDSKSGDMVYETTSDELGRYELELTNGKSYYFKVSDKNYEKYEKRVSLKSDSENLTELEHDIELREKK